MSERWIENALYASRWMLVPLFIGLSGVVLLLTAEFYETLVGAAFEIFTMDKFDLIIVVLKLVDMVLIGSLVVMVAIRGYENFISRINLSEEEGKPTFFSRLDPGTIKVKLALVIIAISSIHLLQTFMDIQRYSTEQIVLLIVIHMAFVISGGAIALIDKVLTVKHGVGGH